MLSNAKLLAFVPTIQPEKAKAFYGSKLGLTLLSEDKFALEFSSNGVTIRVTTVQSLTPHPFTVMGWDVKNISELVKALSGNGIKFEKYDFLEQDSLGVWTAPGGTKVAWFKDPDGNLLSLSQHQ